MANPLEWYAADGPRYGDPSFEPRESMPSEMPTSIFYARVVGYPGPVTWTVIWEPLSGGPTPPSWAGGPLAAGQYPTVDNEGTPNVYVPENAEACAIGGELWESGIVRLSAKAGGVPVPGELVMTLLDSGGVYPDITLTYTVGVAPPDETFWTQHRNTYEIP